MTEINTNPTQKDGLIGPRGPEAADSLSEADKLRIESRLSKIFEADKYSEERTPGSFPGYLYARSRREIDNALGLVDQADQFTDEEKNTAALYDCVLSIRQAHETLINLADVNLLKQQGLLLEHGRNKIRQLIDSMAEEVLTRMGIVILPFMITQGSNKRLQDIHHYDIANDDFIKNFMHKMSFSNPSTGRRDVQRAFDFAVNEPKIGQYQDEARKVVERIENILNPPQSIVEDRGDVDTEILVPEQELKFSVLPKGTRLEEFARDIAEESGEADKTRVDLKRVAILNFIREIWGENQCYFARGKKTGRKMLDDETGLAIDEDYIVLCMQEFEDGEPTGIEHALAISPIARKHAAYLVRHDVSEGLDWRGILSQDKEGAKLLGARPLKFSRPDGTDQYKAMLEKISFLLTCKKEEFGDELRRNPKTGQYTTFRRQVATRAMDDSLSVA